MDVIYILDQDVYVEEDFFAKSFLEKVLDIALSCVPFDSNKSCEVVVRISNDSQLQELNRDYRGKNQPTNVLSFPQGDLNTPAFVGPKIYWGDIVISYETLCVEAIEKNIPILNHFIHLLVHGFFHLLGYDHEEESQAIEMESLEVKSLSKLGDMLTN